MRLSLGAKATVSVDPSHFNGPDLQGTVPKIPLGFNVKSASLKAVLGEMSSQSTISSKFVDSAPELNPTAVPDWRDSFRG